MEDYAHKVSRLTAYLIKQRIKPKAPLYCVDGSEKNFGGTALLSGGEEEEEEEGGRWKNSRAK